MNKWIILLVGCLVTATVRAQELPPLDDYTPGQPDKVTEPDVEPPRFDEGFESPPPGGRMPPPMEAFGESQRPGGHRRQGGGPVEQWLEHLRMRDPQEFERLRILREEDPRAFHDELREKLRQKRASHGMRDGGGGPTFESRPPGQREQSMQGYQRGRKRSMQGEAPVQNNPEIRKLEANSRELARAFRSAGDDAEKARIKEELKSVLDHLFDMRSDVRREALDKMETKLKKLHEKLEIREAKRDAIIHRRLQDLTEGENLNW